MKSLLITGSSGFLGRIVFDYIKLQDFTITTIGRANSDIICDFSKIIPVINVVNVDLVIHLAGKAHSVPRTDIEIQSFFDVNVKGTENLLKGLEQNNLPKQFVFISSVSVYGATTGININEEHPLMATDPYGKSKILAEKLIQDWCAKNMVICTILRLPLVVGTNPPGNLGAMIKGIKKGFYFNIGGGKAKKSMVLASDVALLIPVVAPIGGIYNLTDRRHPNFFDLSTAIASSNNKKKPLNMSVSLAKSLGRLGDFLGENSPINSLKIQKITSDLTFDDSKAVKKINWNPQSVLKFIEKNFI
ncbi:nucleoside-diphosphate-sugar epimerase [Flavobacterium sp. PL11]|uniref:NAD-dependent epimerase/dehydratase family protein n=1 Tax=Flavobacterium sp. PL11 TaxID=3071717 RepID=UPI002E0B5CB4|nr:nucleoside-diphosphate-sugar epimerase [Flavobacterium sp. PL11]